MLAPDDLARLHDVCASIGSEVADEEGFVTVRGLLSRFDTSLLIRPLLVEGMLASVNGDAGAAERWAVLLDSETGEITASDVQDERRDRPLPVRLRNTVAHELVHSLAFRPAEFGLRLRNEPNSASSKEALVNAIEQVTERLSPLLLWPDKAIRFLLTGRKQALSVDDLAATCSRMAISRYVLVNRLRQLSPTDANGFRSHYGLMNLAVGLGEWVGGGRSIARTWPLFINFERSIMPAPLIKLSHQDRVPALALFDESTFAMCGGQQRTIEMVVDAGLQSNTKLEKMRVECAVENSSRRVGSTFLFAIRKLPAQ